ncbi:hypothetical protein [Kitasatospora sp. NPDC101183]|uniref:hypothetical protein n=1 Tax=Kitasatospora sp. NPDC101183 TaxID=3364100 RepID=UPI00381AC226
MAVREDTARDVRHEPGWHGRHGRPRPFGGRFRLPTLRFSGAAMAMSTVVGISIATTLLLNEQQGVGRRAGVARVGTTPPTPTADDRTEAAAGEQGPETDRPSALPSHQHGHGPGRRRGGETAATGPHLPERPAPYVPPYVPANGGQTGDHEPTGAPSPSASPVPTAPGTPDAAAARPGPNPSPHVTGLRPLTPGRPLPVPLPPPVPDDAAPDAPDETDGTDGTTDEVEAEAPPLSGVALRTPLGPDGLRHRLDLTVAEPVTALQTEFRLAPGATATAPGSGSAWTDLPGALVTAQQERGSLVYRFTTPPGTDVPPGRYSFGVHGARPAGAVPAESWNAAAFGIQRPRAVASLGTFPTAAAPRPADTAPRPATR